MKKALFIVIGSLLIGSCQTEETTSVKGKWYTYAESGDYMELWLGEDKAMSYLSAIDQFLLYDLKREDQSLHFQLIESKVIDDHRFHLEVTQSDEESFKAIFIGDSRVDSLKTYFLIDSKTPEIKETLDANRPLMEELFTRLEGGSHAGHGH